jgi:ADP-ribose pyrophosphatase
MKGANDKLLFASTAGSVALDVWSMDVRKGSDSHEQFRIATNDSRGGVVIIPCRSDTQEVLLVQQYRPAVGETLWEFPRGFCETAEPLDDAARELAEETGLRAASTAVLGFFYPDSGLLDGRVTVVFAEISDCVPKGPLDGETSASRWISVERLIDEIAHGKICDGMTLAALTLFRTVGIRRS